MRELEQVFQRGATPDLDALVGWEFRGINHLPLNALPVAQLVGIKKFVKGFFRDEDGRVMGYNCPVVQNVARRPLAHVDARRSASASTRSRRSIATARDNDYLHARAARLRQGRQPAATTRRAACATTSSRSTRRTRTSSSARRTTRVGPLRIAD